MSLMMDDWWMIIIWLTKITNTTYNNIVVVSIHGDDHTIYDYDNNMEWHTIEWQYYGMIILRVIQPRW